MARASTVVAGAAALVGPLLLAVLHAFAVARPSTAATAFVVGLALVVGAADIRLVARRRFGLGAGALMTHALLFLYLATLHASPLPRPPRLAGELPAAAPPAGVAVYQLPTGLIHRTAAFAYRGGSSLERRDFSMAAVLVTHPRGDLLIDAGLGRDVDAQVADMPLAFRLATRITRGDTAAEQLDAAGYDRARLRAILLTHAHWDHVSGAADLPGVPVMVTDDERRFVADGGWITTVARRLAPARYQTYAFDGGPYLGFPRSHDVHGDGAIVVVPAPGHTPGSVIVFVAASSGRRYAFVGDLAWQREGITEREERPWLNRRLADDDPAGTRAGLLAMAAVVERFPEIALVPAHDPRAFDPLLRLP